MSTTTDHLASKARAAVERVDRIAYSPGEAAEALGCSRKNIYAMFSAGLLTPHKIGRLTRISAEQLRSLVAPVGDHDA